MIPNIRRIRYATKGVAIFPMKILTDDEWVEALSDVHKLGRSMNKQVVVHTHSSLKKLQPGLKTMDRLFTEGILVRNQAVLQKVLTIPLKIWSSNKTS